MFSSEDWQDRYLGRLQNFFRRTPTPASPSSGHPTADNPSETSALLPDDFPESSPLKHREVSLDDDEASNLPSAEEFHTTESSNIEQLNYWRLWKHDKTLFWKRILRRSPYYVFPILMWIPKYDWKSNVGFDILAGIGAMLSWRMSRHTSFPYFAGVGCMLIPQALAYALLAQVPPIMGLYTAFFPLIIFAMMSTSRHVAVGPDALVSLLVGMALLKPGNSSIPPQVLAPVFSFIVGIALLLLGIFRFGFLDNVLSRPLLSGFVNAVAVTILLNQLSPFFGLPASHTENTISIISHFFSHVSQISPPTVALGSFCLLFLISVRVLKALFPGAKWLKYIVDTFIIVVVGVAIGYFLNVEQMGVAILGPIRSGLPFPSLPALGDVNTLRGYLDDVLVICIIGFVETIVCAKIYASKHQYTLSPNRELVALGAANIFSSFFSTYPVFGSLTRSSVGDFLGAKSQIYTLISALLVLMTILFAGPFFFYLPRVVMSSIIVVAAGTLIEVHDLLFLIKIKAWKDILLLIFTFVVTVFLGVDTGIFVSIGVSLLLVVKHTSVPHLAILGRNPTSNRWVDAYQDRDAIINPEVLVVKIEEALYFANIEQIKDMFKRIEIFGSHLAHPTADQTTQRLRAIVVHARNVTEMDASAIQTFDEMLKDYQKRNIFVCFVKLRSHLKVPFLRSGIIGALGGDRLFETVDEALKYVRSIRHGATWMMLDRTSAEKKKVQTHAGQKRNDELPAGHTELISQTYPDIDTESEHVVLVHSDIDDQNSEETLDE